MVNLNSELPQPAEDKAEESSTLPHDSMVTVRLSEPPALKLVTNPVVSEKAAHMDPPTRDSTAETPDLKFEDVDQNTSKREPANLTCQDDNMSQSTRRGSEESETSEEVNWEQLEKTEDEEPRDQDSEDSTTLLLARLEQENNLLVTNPKSGLTRVVESDNSSPRRQGRPPSIHQLKKMVTGPTPSALRYSLLPAPPMTDLEFCAALVQDYARTAQRLPTLLSKKIRSGVPPPLRGVVWQSMSGARDPLLEEQFDILCGESSPYEGIIGKDLGRSFPGVEMFRDPEGDGQRMLGRVLKCFSLYDHKIGYCQGLGFLVGPLLMHMGDKQAFCILVRLMERYDLRNCFLPDLSGLHVRIYQFRELLKSHLPVLTAHLDHLQVEPAYVSQWFLSFFAVTCPLPMLFRIYDVIFAEGASETIMRVALSLMQKNEEKLLACTEFEDAMQLLLSRGLWDCYHYNADEFVNDFVSLTSIVTNETLQALETKFKESQSSEVGISPTSAIGSAASRFLGRLWAGSNSSTKSANLSPGTTLTSRPTSFLRRSPSKQSIASTLNSAEGGTDSIVSSASTDATSVSRDSSNTDQSSIRESANDFTSITIPAQKISANSKDLHGQIEYLLMALTELQREQAVLATQLQKEREEREEDRHVVKSLLECLKKKSSSETVKTTASEDSLDTVKPSKTSSEDDRSQLADKQSEFQELEEKDSAKNQETSDELDRLVEGVEARFRKFDNRRSSMLQSKSQLREELVRSKESLIAEASKSQSLTRRLDEMEQELNNLKEEVKEGHTHIRQAHQEKQRLERIVHDLRARNMPAVSPERCSSTAESEWPQRAPAATGGLRELKLARSNSRSHAPTFSTRVSSLNTQNLVGGKENEKPQTSDSAPTSAVDNEALVLELVQAKTAEATAKQEAEEARAKLESLRKMLGMGNGEVSPGHKVSSSQSHLGSATLGAFAAYLARPGEAKREPSPGTTPAASSGGSFWGGWSKRSVSTSEMSSPEKA